MRFPLINRVTSAASAVVCSLSVFPLVSFLLLAGNSQLSAAAVALSIPGAITVSIQPAEAIAAGARWSLDSGPARASDETATNVAAGTHPLQLSKLSAWIEPE